AIHYPDAVIAGILNRQERRTAYGHRFTAHLVSSLRRNWDIPLNDGIIAGEQLTPGAPWRIRLTDDLRDRVAEEAPDDFLTMYQTMRLLGVSRQTVWQRVKRGEIKALHVRRGRKKGLRLKVIRSQSDLFDQTAQAGV